MGKRFNQSKVDGNSAKGCNSITAFFGIILLIFGSLTFALYRPDQLNHVSKIRKTAATQNSPKARKGGRFRNEKIANTKRDSALIDKMVGSTAQKIAVSIDIKAKGTKRQPKQNLPKSTAHTQKVPTSFKEKPVPANSIAKRSYTLQGASTPNVISMQAVSRGMFQGALC